MAKEFTLDDFRRHLDQSEKMSMKDQLGRIPGLSALAPEEEDRDLAFRRIRQMIDAMTDEERRNPDLITSSCLSRIAASSGTQPQDVENFLAQFYQVRAVMHQMAGMSLWQRIKMVLGGLNSVVRQDSGMWVTRSKIAALAVAIGWVIAAFTWETSWTRALWVAASMPLPLFFIWMSPLLGAGDRSARWAYWSLGWLLLLGLPVLLLVIRNLGEPTPRQD
jgi:hypothetical protein